MQESASDQSILETAEMGLDWYAGCQGYDPEFLAQHVDLPAIPPDKEGDVAQLKDGTGHELKYTHYSLVMSKSRQLAFFTAVNIDGQHLVDMSRDKDVWYFDPRIEKDYQMGPDVYTHSKLDRGHLVRRIDPVWGSDAELADKQTFHFTNCSPQYFELNRQTWLGLENYIMTNAKAHDVKVTVFTGPVLRDDDEVYREKYRIPAEFWKVVVFVKDDGTVSATAYLQSQRDLISNLEAWGGFGEYKTYQVPVSHIEQLTELNFGELHNHDPLMPPGLEAAPQAVLVEGLQGLVL